MTHYVMDLNGDTVYHVQPDNTKAWQVGYGNSYVVGIELCDATSQSQFDAQWGEATQWAADYLASRGWGIDRLLSHNDCRLRWGGTDHTDPGPYFAQFGRTWEEFKSEVAAKLDGTHVDAPSTPTPNRVIAVDGYGGTETVTAWQLACGTYADGVISGQTSYTRLRMARVWSTNGYGNGSNLVRVVQRRLGVTVDGYMGRETISALQRQLTEWGYSVGGSGIDGWAGPDTVAALQRSINDGRW